MIVFKKAFPQAGMPEYQGVTQYYEGQIVELGAVAEKDFVDRYFAEYYDNKFDYYQPYDLVSDAITGMVTGIVGPNGATATVGAAADNALRSDLLNTDQGKGGDLVGFKQAGTGAINRTVDDKLREVVSVKDFGAVGDGVADDTLAFSNAVTGANNADVYVPKGLYKLNSDVFGFFVIGSGVSFVGTGRAVQNSRGYYVNDASGANIRSITDRLMVGAVAQYKGDIGSTGIPAWYGAGYLSRDGQLSGVSTYGLWGVTGASRSSDYTGGLQQSCGALGGYVVNDGGRGFVRALYLECQHEPAGTASYGIEIVLKDKSGVSRVPTPYGGDRQGTVGVYIETGGDEAYGGVSTTNSTAVALVTTKNAKKFNKGIVFTLNCLEGSDGTALGGNNAQAIEMAYGQGIRWFSSNGSVPGGRISSINTASQDQSIDIQFKNNGVQFANNSASFSFDINHVANGINYLSTTDAITGNLPRLQALGADTNVGIFFIAKGTSPHRFFSQGGIANEEFRVGGVNSAPVNFTHIYGTNAGGTNVVISAAGSSVDLDIRLLPKGAGTVRFGSRTATADAPITGFITVKDDTGTVRKLAVID
jgi:hypothetical protein